MKSPLAPIICCALIKLDLAAINQHNKCHDGNAQISLTTLYLCTEVHTGSTCQVLNLFGYSYLQPFICWQWGLHFINYGPPVWVLHHIIFSWIRMAWQGSLLLRLIISPLFTGSCFLPCLQPWMPNLLVCTKTIPSLPLTCLVCVRRIQLYQAYWYPFWFVWGQYHAYHQTFPFAYNQASGQSLSPDCPYPYSPLVRDCSALWHLEHCAQDLWPSWSQEGCSCYAWASESSPMWQDQIPGWTTQTRLLDTLLTDQHSSDVHCAMWPTNDTEMLCSLPWLGLPQQGLTLLCDLSLKRQRNVIWLFAHI